MKSPILEIYIYGKEDLYWILDGVVIEINGRSEEGRATVSGVGRFRGRT
jgi:hypothetical protein